MFPGKNGPKRNPIHILATFPQKLFRGIEEREDFGYFCNFPKNCPKKAISKMANIHSIWHQ
jgi:hypothetical protein